MFRRSTAIILASLSLASNAGAAVVALATPSGLAAGTKFRFLFVTTSTRDASSTDVADYNSFVNTDAGGATYNGSAVSWKAIASTSAVDARDNVGGYGDNVAVYLVNGTKLANDMTTGSGGLWSSNLLTYANVRISSTTSNVAVWTGTLGNGLKGTVLGGSSNPTAGNSGLTGPLWLNFIPFGPNASNAFYGVSQELTVPVPVPAPGAIAVLGVAGLANRRRRR